VTARSSFVTGAYGFLGAWLVKALLERGDRVTVLRVTPGGPFALEMMGLHQHVSVVDGDVRDAAALDHALTDHRVESVFHLAAQAIVPIANESPVSTFDANIRGTWTLLDAVHRHEVPHTVVASSDKAYGSHAELPYREDFALQPTFPYDVSKAATDLMARSYWHTLGVPVTVTRCSNLYGGGDLNASRVVPEIVKAVLAGRRPVVRSDGSPERDFVYVEDAAAAYLALDEALGSEAVRGEAFNVGTGTPVSVAALVKVIGRLAETDVDPDFRGTGTPTGEIDRQFVDTSKIRAACGWEPTVELEEGIVRTIDWYREHPEAIGA
jgi:CDP-glucose 4,6-dehydratase